MSSPAGRTVSPASSRIYTVTSVSDEIKGERLVVLHTDAAGTAESLHAVIEKSAIPNLWKPGRADYLRIDALPFTGSGKLDVRALRQMAARQ